jgi:hypothetical protein
VKNAEIPELLAILNELALRIDEASSSQQVIL